MSVPFATPRGARLESLTGLRFVAALLVFAYHAGSVGPAAGNGWTAPGRSGVSFFFVLSGFLLAYTARPDDTPRRFYRRRVARIVPAYLVALSLVLLSAVVLGAGVTGADAVPFTLLQSWVPVRKVFFAVSPVFWSLSTEAFFYLVFPFVHPVFARLGTRGRMIGIALAFLIVLGLAVVLVPYTGTDAVDWLYYIFPPVRFLEFAVGMLLALQMKSGRAPVVPLPLAVASVVVGYGIATALPVTFTAVAATLLPFSLLIWSAAAADLSGRPSPFRSRVLVVLGLWSYAFYLLHLRVLAIALAVARKLGIDVDGLSAPAFLTLVGLVLALAIGLSALLYTLVEVPGEAWVRTGRRPGSTGRHVRGKRHEAPA